MKHFGNQLDEIFRKRKIIQKEFAAKMGVTEVTVTKWKSSESIDASKLESITKILNVPITYWFDETNEKNQSIVNGDGSAASIYGDATAGQLLDKDKEIDYLKHLLKSKDDIIEEKERTIQILIKQQHETVIGGLDGPGDFD